MTLRSSVLRTVNAWQRYGGGSHFQSIAKRHPLPASFRDARHRRAGPESITTVVCIPAAAMQRRTLTAFTVSMDSGLALRAPRNDVERGLFNQRVGRFSRRRNPPICGANEGGGLRCANPPYGLTCAAAAIAVFLGVAVLSSCIIAGVKS